MLLLLATEFEVFSRFSIFKDIYYVNCILKFVQFLSWTTTSLASYFLMNPIYPSLNLYHISQGIYIWGRCHGGCVGGSGVTRPRIYECRLLRKNEKLYSTFKNCWKNAIQFTQRWFPASLEILQETARGLIFLPHKLINGALLCLFIKWTQTL